MVVGTDDFVFDVGGASICDEGRFREDFGGICMFREHVLVGSSEHFRNAGEFDGM